MTALAPFATIDDLERRLGGVTFAVDVATQSQVQAALEDASAHLRTEIIGAQVFPQSEVATTVTGHGPRDTWQAPVFPVTDVAVDGEAVELDEDGMMPLPAGRHTITYTVGYQNPPDVLVSWTCVLASQALDLVDKFGALGASGVSSMAIDDFKIAYADGGDKTQFYVPAQAAESLRSTFGRSVYQTGWRQ